MRIVETRTKRARPKASPPDDSRISCAPRLVWFEVPETEAALGCWPGMVWYGMGMGTGTGMGVFVFRGHVDEGMLCMREILEPRVLNVP